MTVLGTFPSIESKFSNTREGNSETLVRFNNRLPFLFKHPAVAFRCCMTFYSIVTVADGTHPTIADTSHLTMADTSPLDTANNSDLDAQ